MAETPLRQDVDISLALVGHLTELANALLFPSDPAAPATAPIAGETLALGTGTVAARGGAVASITGLRVTLSTGTVTPGGAVPSVPVRNLVGGWRGTRPPAFTRADLARLFPDDESLPPAEERIAAVASVTGQRFAVSIGAMAAEGIQNPTDEDLLALFAALLE